MRTSVVAFICSATLTNCVSGPGPGDNTTGGPTVGKYGPVSGTVVPLLAPGVTAPALDGNFAIQFEDALTDPNNTFGHTLQGGFITASSCTAQGCPLSVANVRIDSSTTTGMWGLAYEHPLQNYPKWTIAASQVATPAQVTAALSSNNTLTGVTAYSLPTDTLNKFAAVAGLTATGSGSSLQSRGAVIGLAQSANVTVTVQDSNLTIYYPNDGFTGVNAANMTGATGMFLVVGPAITGSADKAPGFSDPLTLAGAAGNANTWAAATVDLVPGIIAIEAFPPAGN